MVKTRRRSKKSCKSKKSRRRMLNKQSRKNIGYKVYGGSNPENIESIDNISPTIQKKLLKEL